MSLTDSSIQGLGHAYQGRLIGLSTGAWEEFLPDFVPAATNDS